MGFTLRTWAKQEGHLSSAEDILIDHSFLAIKRAEELLLASARSNLREYKGVAKRTLKSEIVGEGFNRSVDVYGERVQHFIDQEGLPPGTFPPWREGSRIFKWTEGMGFTARPRLSRSKAAITARKRKAKRRVTSASKDRAKSDRVKVKAGANPAGTRGVSTLRGGVYRTSYRQTRQAKVKAKGSAERSRGSVLRERAIRRISYLVARKIFNEGITANKWVTKTVEASEAKVIQIMRRSFKQAIKEINS